MRAIKYMDEDMMIKKAIRALIGELGPVETSRFINMPRKKELIVLKGIGNGKKAWRKIHFLSTCLAKRFLFNSFP